MLNVAVSQLRPDKPDPAATLDRVGRVFAEVAGGDPSPRVLLFPETALTGYFLEGGVREHALEADALFAALRDRWRDASDGAPPLEVGIGFYERHRDRVHNSALYAELGGASPGILEVHRKVFLPTYGVFQEDRFVEAGSTFRAFDTGWGRAAVLICEDAWHSLPGTLAALDGAQVLFVLGASPAHGTAPGPGMPGSLARWERVARGMAQEHGVFVVLAQLTGFEGGKGFPGGSLVMDPRGRVTARGPLWEEALLPASLDLDELLQARHESPLLADLEAALPRILEASPGLRTAERGATGDGGDETAGEGPGGRESRGSGGDGAGERGPAPDADRGERSPAAGPTSPARPDPGDRTPLEIDAALVEEWLLAFLRQEVRDRRGFDEVVVGMSGGVDSSLAAVLCARALGGDAVHGFLLPSEVTGSGSREHALRVAEEAGIATRTIEITDAVAGYLEEHEPDAGDLRRGNVMARVRMIVLYDQARKLDALPVGTGNKSERLLGYFTWHADDAPPVNPLGDLFKTQVRALARHVDVPEAIVEKPPSAGLVAGQTDEGDLGVSYADADLVLHHLLHGRSAERLVASGFDPDVVEVVRRRLESTHFKRHLPTVAMVSSTSIGEGYLRPVDY